MDRLTSLPDETLLQILANLRLHDLLSVTLTCTRLNRVQDASIWKTRCLQDFKSWDGRYNLPSLLAAPIGNVQWKGLYVNRYNVNRMVQHSLDHIISNQAGRLEHVGNIAARGFDSIDVLQANMDIPPTFPDVLARQWFARAMFSHVQRAAAVEVWSKMLQSTSISLLQGLLCFDQFIIGENALSYEKATSILNAIAASILECNSQWSSYTTRRKALAIAAYLLDKNLVGLNDNRQYLNVRNSLLTFALTDREHCSLPLISTIIYCHVAQHLGLNARACGFPMHVYAIVIAEEGKDLDDNILSSQATNQDCNMFLNPYQSSLEQRYSDLAASLPRMGILASDVHVYLQPAEDVDIVMRCGRNIINAVQEGHVESREQEEPLIEHETALYASMWSLLILSSHGILGNRETLSRRRNFLPHLINLFESHHPFDARLVQEYVCPLFDITLQQSLLRNHIQDILQRDLIPRELRDRNTSDGKVIKYYIGQLFRHKRYEYEGVIYGWDPECTMPEDWIQRMRVPELERGEQQPFYHILADDLSTRYIAEDNVAIIKPHQPPKSILRRAGQFFKRWDSQSKIFVSNLKDQYPHG